MANVLIVDTDQSQAPEWASSLRQAGHEVAVADGAAGALAQLERAEPDLILMSMPMLGRDGVPLLAALAERRSDMPPVAVLHRDVVADREPVVGRVGPCRVV